MVPGIISEHWPPTPPSLIPMSPLTLESGLAWQVVEGRVAAGPLREQELHPSKPAAASLPGLTLWKQGAQRQK